MNNKPSQRQEILADLLVVLEQSKVLFEQTKLTPAVTQQVQKLQAVDTKLAELYAEMFQQMSNMHDPIIDYINQKLLD